jgi:hypothetical protein
MYMDMAKLAQEIYDRSLPAVEVDWHQFQPMFDSVEPGWVPHVFAEPESYRWFLIKNFPVKALADEVRRVMASPVIDPGEWKLRRDRIIELWREGAPEWPVFVTAGGVIADGYHRTDAHRTLKHKTTDLIVSVDTSTPGEFDVQWLEAFPSGRRL